jgi:hypothetical protein
VAKSLPRWQAQAQERAEKLTLHILEIAATKVVPVLIMMIQSGL